MCFDLSMKYLKFSDRARTQHIEREGGRDLNSFSSDKRDRKANSHPFT